MQWLKNRFRQLRAAEWVLFVVGGLLFLWCTPAAALVCNAGTVLGMGLGLFLMLFALFFRPIWWSTAAKRALRAALIVFCAVCLLFTSVAAAIGGRMVAAAFTAPHAGEEATLVVLGCYVRGTKVEKSLRRRLEAALAYLQENPDARAVLCGGQGKGEDITEAQAEYEWLTARGIDSTRLYLEDTSENTKQNLANAAQIIARENLPRRVVIATQFYHEYRAFLYAKAAGLDPAAKSASCGFFEAPTYFIREIAGVMKYLILDR